MGKIIMTFGLALLLMASCKKDYTCECIKEVTGFPDATTSITLNGKKKDVIAECEKDNFSRTESGIKTTLTCQAK